MGHLAHHNKINYVEFCATDVSRAKQFYGQVFGWQFQDYGPDYVSFDHATADIDGGFRKIDFRRTSGEAAPLVVIYSADLKATEKSIVAAGGTVVVPTFEFPGGRRFHFTDGVGNTLAVWSE